jgi:hypothetical protein
MSEAIFKGVSGRLHRFTVAEPDADFPNAPAVYAFARPSGRHWVPVFLSRTGNLGGRMVRHPQWEQARRLGATHVLVHRRGERDAREDVEADLVSALRPIMNGPFKGEKDNLVRLQPVAELADSWRKRASR